jgi:hypothetical protein
MEAHLRLPSNRRKSISSPRASDPNLHTQHGRTGMPKGIGYDGFGSLTVVRASVDELT